MYCSSFQIVLLSNCFMEVGVQQNLDLTEPAQLQLSRLLIWSAIKSFCYLRWILQNRRHIPELFSSCWLV